MWRDEGLARRQKSAARVAAGPRGRIRVLCITNALRAESVILASSATTTRCLPVVTESRNLMKFRRSSF